MKTSEQVNEIAAALAKAQGVMEGAAKDAENPFFHSKYADLASVLDACRKALSDNGLCVIQSPSTEGAFVHVETMLAHSSGQWIRGVLTAEAKDGSPQSVGSAITYLRRYALQSMTGVAPEDDDGEAAGRPSAAPQRASEPTPKGEGTPICQKCGSAAKVIKSKFGPGHYCLACKANVQVTAPTLFDRPPSSLSPDELAAAGVE